ncbi:hypothetical protein TCDM_11982 [Trypanosoma cruzi Dm28c]|uniref:Uncharacterized protein n=1 Tax=Trypanosoma cruzi Dm28c TaxID=1416333 RepID=V5B3F6_TRYCR|nr:hypothetical protein TCDM_11982 [Trypanosoma cruzi Dm28c]
MRRSFPWSVVESAARGVCDEAVAEEPGPSRVPAFVLPACLACWHAWQLRWRPAREAPVRMTVKQSRHPHGRLSNHWNAGPSTSSMCPHTVDGRAHSAAGWTGGRQSAARWSTRSCGAHVGKRFRRRQRRAGHRSQGGTAPPTQRVPCDPQGACRPVEEWAGVASRLCAVPPLGHDVRVNSRNRDLAAPEAVCCAVGAPSFSSSNFFQYGHLTAVRKPTCQALTQSCGRDRAMTLSAVTLLGIPRRRGENVELTMCDLDPPVKAASS